MTVQYMFVDTLHKELQIRADESNYYLKNQHMLFVADERHLMSSEISQLIKCPMEWTEALTILIQRSKPHYKIIRIVDANIFSVIAGLFGSKDYYLQRLHSGGVEI